MADAYRDSAMDPMIMGDGGMEWMQAFLDGHESGMMNLAQLDGSSKGPQQPLQLAGNHANICGA